MAYTVDIDEYLGEFNAEKVANKLLLSTLTKQDLTVDINAALTRLKYDRVEVSRQIESLCRLNCSVFLNHASEIDNSKEKIANLQPELRNVVTTSSKLEKEFLEPFKSAQTLFKAANNLHRTAELSREVLQYLQLALQVQSVEYTRESRKTEGVSGLLMLRNATALKQLLELVRKDSKVLEITVCAQFYEQVPSFKRKLHETASAVLTEFNGQSSAQIRLAALTLHLISTDLPLIVEKCVKQLATASAVQLAKASVPANLGSLNANASTASGSVVSEHQYALSESFKRSVSAESLVKTCSEICGKQLEQNYWPQLAQTLNQRLKTMSVTNQQGLKALQANKQLILSSVKELPALSAVYERYMK